MMIESVIAGVCILLLLVSQAGAEVFLPGMQPKESGIEFVKVQQCKMCHSRTENGSADPFFSWQSSMMSQAARDPVFRASLTIANQDIEGVGEFCLRCHAPRGWLEDRSTPADGSALNREDMHGVSCDICHRLMDPLSSEARKLIKDVPPGYGNAMMVADPANVVVGPYGDGIGAMPHNTRKSEYHASGNLCATCHNISNPLQASDVKRQPPHAFGHIERTYSEWVLSDFSKQGRKGTCQSCHYPVVEAQAKKFGKKPGKSFHFVLNDIIAKDNRIPPKGFKNSAFKEHLSEPVGAVYSDGQHWDDVQLEPSSGCERIVVNLMYQSVSWEYLKFLAEENRTDDWGKRLYEAWNQTGKCAPVVIAELDTATVQANN